MSIRDWFRRTREKSVLLGPTHICTGYSEYYKCHCGKYITKGSYIGYCETCGCTEQEFVRARTEWDWELGDDYKMRRANWKMVDWAPESCAREEAQ